MSSKYPSMVLSALFFGALAGCVVAPAPPPPRPAPPPVPSSAAIDARQRDLEFRIEQGFRSGHITRDEHTLLRRMADDVRREERRYMNDGMLSLDERQALAVQLDTLSREFNRQMRDGDRR